VIRSDRRAAGYKTLPYLCLSQTTCKALATGRNL
jgi:hypothetical protein